MTVARTAFGSFVSRLGNGRLFRLCYPPTVIAKKCILEMLVLGGASVVEGSLTAWTVFPESMGTLA